jgi:hypothetical protein
MKNFSSIGREFGKSSQTIGRMIDEEKDTVGFLRKKINSFFSKDEKVTLIVDDTLIEKRYAYSIEGTGFFYNSMLKSECRSYKIITCVLTNGKKTLPINFEFLMDTRLIDASDETDEKEQVKRNKKLNKEIKDDFIYKTIDLALQYIPKERLIVAVDGWFISVEFLTWAIQNNIKVEGRARGNYVVCYNNTLIPLRDIKRILPRGRQTCRTVKIIWHDLTLFVTVQKRVDRHGNRTFVYQFATYKAKKSIDHVKQYKKRWPIEQFFRTCKQYLGLKECQSTSFEIQRRHIWSVFCAFAIAQEWAIIHKLSNTEAAIRSLQAHKNDLLDAQINRFNRIFNQILS